MIEHIKTVVRNYLNNVDLADLVFGTVIATAPLQIQIDKLIIPGHKLIKSNLMEKVGISLKKGDKVVLLKRQGGQVYYILDLA